MWLPTDARANRSCPVCGSCGWAMISRGDNEASSPPAVTCNASSSVCRYRKLKTPMQYRHRESCGITATTAMRLRLHTFGHAGAPSSRRRTAQECLQTNNHVARREGAPSRWPTSSRPIDAGWRVPPPRRHQDGGSLSSQCDALRQVLPEHQPVMDFLKWLVR